MWIFYDFCIIQNLREINFEDFWSAKSAILPHLEALNFDIYDFLHFLKAEIDQINKIQIFLSLRFYVRSILLIL